MKNVIVLIGAGQIGQAIARRVGVGKHIMLGRYALGQCQGGGAKSSKTLDTR